MLLDAVDFQIEPNVVPVFIGGLGRYDILIDRYPPSKNYPSNLAPYGERYLGVCRDLQ